jgi:hypothetical protein
MKPNSRLDLRKRLDALERPYCPNRNRGGTITLLDLEFVCAYEKKHLDRGNTVPRVLRAEHQSLREILEAIPRRSKERERSEPSASPAVSDR